VSTSRAASPQPPARRRDEEVHSITSAPEPLADDQARRTRRYLIQMGIRVVCFVGAYYASGWLRWTLVAFAVVIPYAAVILVNAGRDRVEYATSPVAPRPPEQLTAGPVTADAGDGPRVVDHEDVPPAASDQHDPGPRPADREED
jgi:hypothetical protein